jgi:hypothetical protein
MVGPGRIAQLVQVGTIGAALVTHAELQAANTRFLDDHNTHSKPFEWVADPNKIIAAVRRGHQVLDSIHCDLESAGQLTPEKDLRARSASSSGFRPVDLPSEPSMVGSDTGRCAGHLASSVP